LGVGLRWWYTDRFPVAFQPPNAEMDTLTAAGVVGLAAFLALLVGTWVIARRIDPVFGVLAELVLLARFVQSQFDLFWVSMQASLPFIVLGLCLGALAHHEAEQERLARTGQLIDQALHPTGVST
jgi:predicted membrane protein